MVTNSKSITNTKRLRQQSSKQVVDGIDIRDGADPSTGNNVRRSCIGNVARIDIMQKQPSISEPSISSSSIQLVEIYNDNPTSAISASNKLKVATNQRRSERKPKAVVTKKARSTKHAVSYSESHSVHTIGLTTTNDDVFVSPLCVKKKMSRRTLMRNQCANSKKKLPITKATATSRSKKQSIGDSKTMISAELKSNDLCNDENLKCANEERSADAQNAKTKASIKCISTVHQDPETHHIDNVGAYTRVCDGLLYNESILFEASPDFWNHFLLDTYYQIASNNPDLPDFEPLPYQSLARGIPVETENSSGSNQGSSFNSDATFPTSKESMYSYSFPKPANPSVNIKANALSDTDTRKSKVTDVKAPSTNINRPSNMNTKLNLAKDNCRDEAYSKDPKFTVGPDSWQMDVVNRMLFYLDSETNCPYSIYRTQFHTITKNCTKLHFDGNAKYRHLPGAIFEQIVNHVGGSIFLSIYKAAKRLSYGRLDSDVGIVIDKVSTDGPSSTHNLIQLAIGYGYCMAKSKTFKGRKICPDVPKPHSLKYVTEIGAQTLVNMSNEARLSFWNECILHN